MIKLLKMNYEIYKLYKKKQTLKSKGSKLQCSLEIDKKEKRLKQEILEHFENQHTFLYCSKCNSELLSNMATVIDEDTTTGKMNITCGNCKTNSLWDTRIAPIPLMINVDEVECNSEVVLDSEECISKRVLIYSEEGAKVGKKVAKILSQNDVIVTITVPDSIKTVSLSWATGFVEELSKCIDPYHITGRVKFKGDNNLINDIHRALNIVI